jgi:type IX secretion system PorP/SprF family membrane protein
MKKLLIYLTTSWRLLCSAYAQDPHFSQFYSNMLYTNPAFAGSSGNLKFSLNGRKQFTNIPNSFYTSTASMDMRINKTKSALGFIAMYDQAGSAAYTTSSASAIYAYKVKLNKTLFMSFAIQAELVNRNVNMSNLVFADQLETEQGIVRNTNENIGSNQRFYPNFSTGALIYSKTFFAGMAIHNLTEPNHSFINTTSRDLENLHLRRYTFHAGGNMYTSRSPRKAVILSPNLLCMFQGQAAEVNLGVYARKNQFTTGLWLRQTMHNADAIIGMIGYKYNRFSFGYSYDWGIGAYSTTIKSGHEISIQFELENSNRSHPSMKLPCPNL